MTVNNERTDRAYQYSFFKFLFGTHRNREFALDLYNTLNHTDYTNTENIKIVTKNDIFYVFMKDDDSFMFCDWLILRETQSVWIANLPLTAFLHYGDAVRSYLHEKGISLTTHKKIVLPTVCSVAFYSDDRKIEDGTVLRLSAYMYPKIDNPGIDAKVRLYNIGRNIDTLNSCKPAHEYSLITTDIEDFMAEGCSCSDAILKALDKVDSSYVLYPIVCSEYDEVRDMLNREYTLEEAPNDRLEEGRKEKTVDVIVAMLKKSMHLDDIIEISNTSEGTVRLVAEKYGLHVEE